MRFLQIEFHFFHYSHFRAQERLSLTSANRASIIAKASLSRLGISEHESDFIIDGLKSLKGIVTADVGTILDICPIEESSASKVASFFAAPTRDSAEEGFSLEDTTPKTSE